MIVVIFDRVRLIQLYINESDCQFFLIVFVVFFNKHRFFVDCGNEVIVFVIQYFFDGIDYNHGEEKRIDRLVVITE